MKTLFIILTALLTTSCSIVGIQSEEQPNYEVIYTFGKKEIRAYKPYIIAETTVNGTFKEAQGQGFKILADYIFGNNTAKIKIAMTAPVIQKKQNEKMAMTAPVFMEESKNKKNWTMTFTMPSKYNMETLPKPNNSQVTIRQVPQKLMAASKYSGFWNEKKNLEKHSDLLRWMNKSEKYNAMPELIFAGYNPPWTLPFFRRNEVLVELEAIQ